MKKLLLSAFVLVISIAAFSQQRVARQMTREERLNEEYCTGMFKTIDGTYFDLLNDQSAISASSYTNILDWLQGRVAGLQIYTTRNDDRIAFIRNNRAGIYVDEILRDPGFLSVLPVADIAMVKIIKTPFAGGFGGSGGAIAIYTIKGEGEEEESD